MIKLDYTWHQARDLPHRQVLHAHAERLFLQEIAAPQQLAEVKLAIETTKI